MDGQSLSGSSERRRLETGSLVVLAAVAGLVALLAWSVWLTAPIARGYLSGTFAPGSRADFASNPPSRFAPQRASSPASSPAPASAAVPGSSGVQSPP